MGKELSPIKNEDGVALTDEGAFDLFDEREIVPFVWTRRDGREVALQLLVDPANITDAAFRKYLREIGKVGREAEERDKRAKELAAMDAIVEAGSQIMTALDAIADGESHEPEADADAEDETAGLSTAQFDAVADYKDLMAQLAEMDAELLAPALVHPSKSDGTAVRGWNVPGAEPTVGVLCASTGPGPAAREALKSWFFPTSNEPEAETGSDETASTPITSQASAPKDDAEATPATS